MVIRESMYFFTHPFVTYYLLYSEIETDPDTDPGDSVSSVDRGSIQTDLCVYVFYVPAPLVLPISTFCVSKISYLLSIGTWGRLPMPLVPPVSSLWVEYQCPLRGTSMEVCAMLCDSGRGIYSMQLVSSPPPPPPPPPPP